MLRKLVSYFGVIVALTVISLLTGCSSTNKPLNADEWTYKPKAINVSYTTTSDLNLIDNEPHNLTLAVIQTTQLQNVQHFLETGQGISKVLESDNSPDRAKNYFVNRYYVTPNESNTLHLTRMAGMKFVVIIAAYNNLIPAQTVKIFNIPVDSHIDGIKLWKRIYYPAQLNIDLSLGSQGILSATSQR